ncbi:hypothetical protein PLANPX_3222 [Lacipirellula parvula]|uniref:Uncharacterized protein n=1 Tax=Lacipirellula parvula TaxID=2650471 RepID=A0A5K7XA81_9BACT|nr:hypothetical protein PLANPX_3222 [Lacipirellula parvula]
MRGSMMIAFDDAFCWIRSLPTGNGGGRVMANSSPQTSPLAIYA